MTCPVARLAIVTWAPRTTAAEGSVTLPTMLPVPTVVWADKGQTKLARVSIASAIRATPSAFRQFRGEGTICYLPFGKPWIMLEKHHEEFSTDESKPYDAEPSLTRQRAP